MNPNHEQYNDRQKELRAIIRLPEEFQNAISLFLNQHAMVHTNEMSGTGLWSFEDEIWQGLSDKAFRTINENGIHSIAWAIWHITRIEDVTMNGLVAGREQVFSSDDWQKRMNTQIIHTGNAMNVEAVSEFSTTIDSGELKAYRMAVGRRTREIVGRLTPEDLTRKVDPLRLERIVPEGWVLPEAGEVINYWSGLDIAGFLLMPPTRHSFIHLNEASQIKTKIR